MSTGKQNLCRPVLSPVTMPNTANSVGSPADHPVHTITSAGNQMLVEPVLSPCIVQNKFDNAPMDIQRPVSTITAVGSHELVSANLLQYHAEQTETARVNSLEAALPTVDASNRYALTTAHLVEYFSTGRPLDVAQPLHTVTSRDREALTTVHVAEFKGQDIGQSADKPLRTITASAGEFAAVHTKVTRYAPGTYLGYWPQVRALLNKYCGYMLADDEVLLIRIQDACYFIFDIGLRMLTPKELYAAMGFPLDYIIERDYTGKPYPKSAQVARCGNAVCPPMATAVVRANLPEWCGVEIETMEQLKRKVAI